MEKLNEAWLLYGQPIVSSALFSTICTAIMVAVIKGTISKKYSKLNVDNELNKIANIVLDRFKGMTFKQNIEPLVKAELLDIRQELAETIHNDAETLRELDLKIAQLVYDFTNYFVNSTGIPEECREVVKQDMATILEITNTRVEDGTVETIPEIEDVPEKEHKHAHKTENKHNDVAR